MVVEDGYLTGDWGGGMNKVPIPDYNKYFTPSIEDIKVGYTVETVDQGKWMENEVGSSLLSYEHVERLLRFNPKYVRTPYLTKEQIEGEGWKFSGHQVGEFATSLDGAPMVFVSKDDERSFTWDGEILDIYGVKSHYVGRCPSINEFRQIQKLLNIK